MDRYATVVLADIPRTIDKGWTYRIPLHLASANVGSSVLVPFGAGKRTARGFITDIKKTPPSDIPIDSIKNIDRLLKQEPVVTKEQIKIAREMRRRYYCTMGDALDAMVPPTVLRVKDRSVLAARLVDRQEAIEQLDSGDFKSMKQVRVVELLLEHESASCVEIRQAAGITQSVIRTLAKRGVLELFQKQVSRDLPEDTKSVSLDSAPSLTADQKSAVQAIEEASDRAGQGTLKEILLFGITGSGKTEVYLHAAEHVLAQGRQVLILVPEIALTPQMTRRLTSRFGDRVAILHSRLTPAERYETWGRVLAQEIPIVVGARSAIFAPLKNVGLIVVDEEQESSYKAESKPRYYAPDIARIRALLNNAVLVMGSATPQVSTFWRAKEGTSQLLTLPGRISRQGLAEVEIVDMRREYAKGNLGLFSDRFCDLLEETLERGEQAMILLNRRGFSRTVVCRVCGWQMRCASCDIALTTHVNPYAPDKVPERCVCHLCDRVSRVPKLCPECGSEEIAALGAGTQQVEEELKGRFPNATVLRMDQDTTRGRFSHRELLDAFENKKADILVGTQMIAKGHDFHNVTLSAILSADQLLGTGEFRGIEQAFALMTQAAGRAGRGLLKGRVIIQTVQPDHYVIRAAAQQDYESFYGEEIIFRKRMDYLPFGHIGMVEFRGFNARETEDMALRYYRMARSLMEQHRARFKKTELSEPAPSPISKIRNRYRFRVIARDPSAELLTRLLFHTADHMEKHQQVSFFVDIDPWATL